MRATDCLTEIGDRVNTFQMQGRVSPLRPASSFRGQHKIQKGNRRDDMQLLIFGVNFNS